jgi:hypothetical protein
MLHIIFILKRDMEHNTTKMRNNQTTYRSDNQADNSQKKEFHFLFRRCGGL